MDRTFSVRLDDVTAQALGELRAQGLNPSALMREALRRCAVDAREPGSRSASAGHGEELEARWITDATEPLAADPDEREAADAAEVWERYLAKHWRRGEVPIIPAWRERDEAGE